MSVPRDREAPNTPPLAKEVLAERFQNILRDTGYDAVASQDKPKAIILAGQPGAGKGGITRATLSELASSGGAVSLDPDELRKYHPDIARLKSDYPYSWSTETHSAAQTWTDQLRDKAMADKKNIIIDSTLGNAGRATEMVEELKKAGYAVEIRAMAAHKLESELGVDKRFTDGLQQEGAGRYVIKGVRETVYDRLPGNLKSIQDATDVPISIYDRDSFKNPSAPRPIYDSRSDARSPDTVMRDARDARVNEPTVMQGLRDGWQAQANLHEQLPGKLTEWHIDTLTAERLLAKRSELRVVEDLARNVSTANSQLESLSKKTADSVTDPSLSPPSPRVSSGGVSAQVQSMLSGDLNLGDISKLARSNPGAVSEMQQKANAAVDQQQSAQTKGTPQQESPSKQQNPGGQSQGDGSPRHI